jgi:two-component system nitrogen regulation response regulator GlnG
MPTFLLIDDEPGVRYAFKRALAGETVNVWTAETAAEGVAMFHEHRPDVVVLDIQLPDRNGMDVFRELHALDGKRPIIFITAHGTTDTAIEAMKGGAFDYLLKPIDLNRLRQVIDRAAEAARLMDMPARLPEEENGDRIVGRSPVMQEMCKQIGRVAPQDVNVLVLGESGTGKELVARAIYQHSRRAERPFLAINCAAIPEPLMESELFGHEVGAFTGARSRRIGKFEQCDGGTLLFDEVGDLSLTVQVKLLRVLQEQQFERLGSNETVQTHVRILAATNQDLEKLVQEGRFRKDLYYRLRGVAIRVPPLRERVGDVGELAHYFLYRFDRELSLDLRAFAPETLEILEAHSWPGNVRELQGVIRQAMLNSSGNLLLPEFLPEGLGPPPASAAALTAPTSAFDLGGFITKLLDQGETEVYRKVIEAVERILLPEVLRQTHGHQAQTSQVLGLNRATLRHKLRSLGMAIDKVPVEEQRPEK